MRVITIAAALALAPLGVAPAAAAGLHNNDGRFNDGRFISDFGVGGWSFDVHGRPPASGAVAAAPSVRNEIDYRAAAPGGFADRERLWLWLSSDSDCVFVAQPISGGVRRLPGCK
jgi:hypothetical protein